MTAHRCTEKDNIKCISEEIQKIYGILTKEKEERHKVDTRLAIQESDMKAVKGDIQEMKTDIKELGVKMDKNFENQDNKSSKIIWFIMVTAIGTLINIALVLLNK